MRLPTQSLTQNRLGNAVCVLLSFLILTTCLFYSYNFLKRPNFGFLLYPYTWAVDRITEPCHAPTGCLELGDQVLQIGDTRFGTFRNSRSSRLYNSFKVGQSVDFVILRNDQQMTVAVQVLPGTRAGALDNFLAFFFPLIFWLTGSIAIVFLRPRDERWLLLVAFWYDVALWTASGFVSATQMSYSSVVFNFSIWLFIPLIIHLHLILPNSILPRIDRWILPPLYLATLTLLILDQLYLLERSVNLQLWLISIGTSLVLLASRYFRQVQMASRVASRLMAFGVAIGLGPFVITLYITLFLNLLPKYNRLLDGVAMLVVPIWPMSYLYAIYKLGRSKFEFRANRLLTSYGFFSAYIALFVATYFVLYYFVDDNWPGMTEDPVIFSLLTSALFVALGPTLRNRFQQLVDRNIFGIRYRPEALVSGFAERIPTSFNREILKHLIVTEILPTLLIRQSCLYLFDEEDPTPLYIQDLPSHLIARPLDREQLAQLLTSSGRHLKRETQAGPMSWIRLVIPLSIADRYIGVWLFGRRDPDDFYPESDISLLRNLANQIAPVTEHVRLVEAAQQEIEENRRLQNQLVQSQKMEAVGRLSAGIAHDFNNLLSVIIGYSDLLLARFRGQRPIQEYVSDIRDAGKRASVLTKQLLTFSRQQAVEAQVVDLNRVISEVESLLSRAISGDIELKVELGSSEYLVMVDPGQIEQVLLNLAVNASDAMPNGGVLAVSTDRGDQTAWGNDLNLPTNDFVHLSVADSGCGIPNSALEHIFEPFFTTKDIGKGTGLGLSMVYGIISQSDGYIFVDSRVARRTGGQVDDQSYSGTRFDIYLPLTTEKISAPLNVPEEPTDQPSGIGTILVVEDNDIVRKVTCEILRDCGYQVIEASDGKLALRVFEQHTGHIDLLLTDVVMPAIRGPELARRLLLMAPSLRVILMSGYNDESMIEGGVSTSWPMIRKPFSPASLCREIHAQLDSGSSPASK